MLTILFAKNKQMIIKYNTSSRRDTDGVYARELSPLSLSRLLSCELFSAFMRCPRLPMVF